MEALSCLLEIIRRRRMVLLTAFMVTTTVAMVMALTKPPIYEASSTLLADKSPPVVLLTGSGGRESTLVQQSLAQASDALTMTELAKSEAVRDAAATRLAPLLDPMRARDILAKRVRVQQVRSTDLVRISVRYRDPRVAAQLANALAQSVVDQDLKARRRLATIARAFIGEQLDMSGRALRASHHDLAAFKKGSHDVSLSDETQLNLHKLDDLRAALVDIRQQKQQLDAGFSRPLGGPRPGTSQAFADPVITTLQSQLASFEVEYSGLRKQFTPLHPQVLSTQAKIDETQRRLSAEVARKRAALADRERSLSTEIDKLQEALMQVPTREALLARFTLDARDAERKYLQLSEKFQEARIAEGSVGSSVRIVDAAMPPRSPVGPQRQMAMIVGMMLGLLVGVGGVYALEQVEPMVTSAREATRITGAPVLGMVPVPAASTDSSGMADRDTSLPWDTRVGLAVSSSESFRMLRTRLLHAMRIAESRCVVVTSALPGEGKSSLVANLAVSVAQTDRHVWLVDCNLRRPTVDRAFPEAHSLGLSAFLAGRGGLDDIVRPTRYPRLTCVVGGAPLTDPAELLDTQLMTGVLEQARARADIVLVDCPATGSVTDAEVVCLRADAAVLVVQLNRTDKRALRQARQRLNELGIRLLGLVVNEAIHPASVPLQEIGKRPDFRARTTMLLARLRWS